MLWAILDMAHSGVGDIKLLLVRREGETVRLDEISRHGCDLAIGGIETIDIARADLGSRGVALIFRIDAIGRIGKPDRSVRLHHEIVRRIELFALETIGEHLARTVMFDA